MKNTTISGYISKEPKVEEHSYIGNDGTEIRFLTAEIILAVFDRKKKENEKYDKYDFYTIKVIGRYAEIVEKYCHKGQKLLVLGELKQDKYLDKNEEKKTFMYIKANRIELMSNKNGDENGVEIIDEDFEAPIEFSNNEETINSDDFFDDENSLSDFE